MKLTLLCSNEEHPVNKYINNWISENSDQHQISLIRAKNELVGGDILFLISCTEVIEQKDRELFKACLVLHASNLPEGRGWSPHIWSIVDGESEYTLSLIEAEDKVDTGRIWHQKVISVKPDELWDEINDTLFLAEMDMLDFAIQNFNDCQPVEQNNQINPTYYPRRTPEHSLIDPFKSIASQFNAIRVCDPVRFPAFFELHGCIYKLTVEKINEEAN